MKKIIILFIAITLFSCNDGDFDVPAFEFTDTVNSCGEYLLYKLNTEKTEAIIISLTPTQLGTTAGEKTFTISSTLKVTYRLFDEAIGTPYFCQEIPPAKPIVLKELEVWAKTLGFKKCVLETGKMQLEAIALYKKQGYKIIKNYGPYKMVEDSICLQKLL